MKKLEIALAQLIRRDGWRRFFLRLLYLLRFFIYFMTSILLLDYFLGFSEDVYQRLSLLLWGISCSGVLIAIVITGTEEGLTTYQAARLVEKKHPTSLSSADDLLSTAITLSAEQNKQYGFSKWLVNTTKQRAAKRWQNQKFSSLISLTPSFKKIFFTLLPIMLLVPLLLMNSLLLESFYRSIRAFSFGQLGPKPGILKVEPGHCQINAGESLLVKVTGSSMPTMTLETKYFSDQQSVLTKMDKTRQGFQGKIVDLRQNFSYRLRTLREVSPWYQVRILHHPFVTAVHLHYQFPEYTGISVMVDENNRNIAAVTGTKMSIFTRSSLPLKEAYSIINQQKTAMTIKANIEAEQQFTLKESGFYSLHLVGVDGLVNLNPEQFRIDVQADLAPQLTIISPPPLLEWKPGENIKVNYRVEDDYGITSAKLHTQYQEQSGEVILHQVSVVGQTVKRLASEISLELPTMLKEEGGVLTYWLEATDNDGVSGAKTSKSSLYRIIVAPPVEIVEQFEKMLATTEVALEKLQQQQERLIKDEKDLLRHMEKSMIPDTEEKKAAEFIFYRQKKIMEEAQAIEKMLEEKVMEVKENPFMKNGLMEKFARMQQLLSELASPEMAELMSKLNQNVDQMELTREDFKQFNKAFNPEKMAERFERMVKLLEKMKEEQQLHSLTKKLAAMLEEQRELKNEIEKLATNPDIKPENRQIASQQLGERQKELAALLQQLQRELSALQKKIGQYAPQSEKELDGAGKKINEARESEENAAASLSENMMKDGMEQAKNAISALQNALAEMEKASASLMKERSSEVVDGLTKAARFLFYVLEGNKSIQQRMIDLRDLQAMGYSRLYDEHLRETASTLNQIHRIVQEVMQLVADLSGKSFKINPELLVPINELRFALRKMETFVMERQLQTFVTEEKKVVVLSTSLIVELLQLADQVKKTDKNSLMQQYMQKLEEMAKQQAKLNAQMQKMSNSGQMTPQMMREYAMEQAMLQQGMEELSGHFDERSAMRQRLMQLKDEMQDLEAEYLKRNISEKIQQRQKQLQQRMLDTVKSMRQEGEDKEERKAETARPFVPRITDRTIDLPLQKKIRGVLEKMKMENYPREYDELIRRYFERIGR